MEYGVYLLPGVEIGPIAAVATMLPLCGRYTDADRYQYKVAYRFNPMVVFVHIFLSTSVHIWFFECVEKGVDMSVLGVT
jgi:hypothetical protein